MRALLKSAVVAIGCAGAMRYRWYRRLGTWALRSTGSDAA